MQPRRNYRRISAVIVLCVFTGLLLLPSPSDKHEKYAREEVDLLYPPFTKRLLGRTEQTYTNPLIDKTKSLIFCWIPKVACTQFKALFCRHYGFDNVTDTAANDSYIHFKCFKPFMRYSSVKHSKLLQDPSIPKWAVIRDPIDRFLSGYLDKCALSRRIPGRPHTCYGCNALDVECFVRTNYQTLRNFTGLTMKEFPKAYVKWQNVDHFYPQFWNCGFHAYARLYKYFIYSKNASFARNMRNAFKSAGFDPAFVDAGWGDNMTASFLGEHRISPYGPAAPAFVLDELKKRPDLIQTVLRTYWIDYMRLPALKVPEWVESICKRHATSCSDFLTLDLSR